MNDYEDNRNDDQEGEYDTSYRPGPESMDYSVDESDPSSSSECSEQQSEQLPSLLECKVANLVQGHAEHINQQANLVWQEANAVHLKSIGEIKQLQHDLLIRRKRARLYFARQKLALQREEAAFRRERDEAKRDREEAKRVDKQMDVESRARDTIQKRQREYDDAVDMRQHEKKMQLLDEKGAHDRVVRECAIEFENRKRKIELEYEAIVAQQLMVLANQEHEVRMCRLEEKQKIAELSSELCNKYGAKLKDSLFQ